MLRLPVVARYTRESCRVLARRTLATKGDGGDHDGDHDNQRAGATHKQSKHVDKEQENHPKKSKSEIQLEKRTAAKSKLAGLLSSLAVTKSMSPPPEESLRPPVQLAKPPVRRRRKPEESLKPEERKLMEDYDTVGPDLTVAVRSVAKEVGGGVATQSELLKSLKKWHNKGPDDESAEGIKDLLAGLTVEKKRTSTRRSTRSFISRSSEPAYGGDSQPMQITKLFEAEPLNIFTLPEDLEQQKEDERPQAPVLLTWDALVAKELKLSVTRAPTNHFQELILWTEQGKIWQFPIDNEIGLEEEKSVGFQDHIFLERHVASWCPKTGPIAHFMELVCVGLSKNPHITAERKRNTIDWYRDYFEGKRTLLEEVGAFSASSATTAPSEETI